MRIAFRRSCWGTGPEIFGQPGVRRHRSDEVKLRRKLLGDPSPAGRANARSGSAGPRKRVPIRSRRCCPANRTRHQYRTNTQPSTSSPDRDASPTMSAPWRALSTHRRRARRASKCSVARGHFDQARRARASRQPDPRPNDSPPTTLAIPAEAWAQIKLVGLHHR